MKNKNSFFLKKSFSRDAKDKRKIFVCCVVFVSVFFLRFVAEKQEQANFSIVISTSEANQIKTVAEDVSQQDRIDINSAHLGELQSLPGIGPKIAAEIIKSREVDGPFREADDLLRIKGIGTKKLEKITPFLRFDPSETK